MTRPRLERFSFHGGHSGAFCRHARGTLDEIVEQAIARGFTAYGISEHGPRFREQDRYPDEHDLSIADLLEMFSRYREEAKRVQQRFAGELEVFIGFETEVVPPGRWKSQMGAIRDEPWWDYIVGSVHHVGDHCIDYSAEATATAAAAHGGFEALARAYFRQLTAMVEFLRPQVVGHFDLIRKFDPSASFDRSVRSSIHEGLESVQATSGVLDLNGAPARRKTGPPYPSIEILRMARDLDIRITLGDDSHGPDEVGVGLNACLDAALEAGYAELQCLARTDSGVDWRPVAIDQVARFANGA